jgi:hypothetical protein
MSRSKNSNHDVLNQSPPSIVANDYQPEDVELAEGLLRLRQVASGELRQRVQQIGGVERTRQLPGRRAAGRPVGWSRALRPAGVLAGILVVAALLLLATVPSVRAALDRLFEQRFGIVLVEPSQLEAPILSSAGDERAQEVQEAMTVIPQISFHEAQAQVDFPIPQPAVVPEGLELWATHVSEYPARDGQDGSQTIVVLQYLPAGGLVVDTTPALSLLITNKTGLQGGYAVAAGAEESVAVNGAPAVYARGAWERIAEDEPPAQANLFWDAGSDAAMLSWEADGFTYTLQGYLLGLSREDYIRIAESVR